MQKSRSVVGSILFGTISLLVVVSMYALPTVAHAQVLNPVTTCTTPIVGEFTPYVYEGQLDSFDYYIQNQPGTGYLPLGTVINGDQTDLSYVSVWRNVGNNRVKIHVDVPNENLGGNIRIDVSVLQVTQGPPPICPTTATFHVNLPTVYAPATPTVPTSPVISTPSTPTAPSQPQKPVTPQKPVVTNPAATTTNEGAVIGQCTEVSLGWLIALAVLDIIISALLLLYMSVIVKTNGRLILAVLLPPLVFIALWYFLNTCHTHVWFPILGVILGIIVLTGSGTPETFDDWKAKIKAYYVKFMSKKTTTLTVRDTKTQITVEKK